MKDLIILAKGHTRGKCPFDGAEVWGVNDVGSFPEFKGKHIDRLFTFDPRADNFLQEMKDVAPITSWRDYADVKYPTDELIKHFKTKYFTNTISYMLALAIYEGFERIRMYGVDAPYGGIYFMEKSGIEYWVGRAEEHGIEVVTCEGSTLLRTHDKKLYGERDGDGLISLYLSERMALMNILPVYGNYDTIYRSGLVRWFVGLKARERDEHKVVVGSSVDGTIVYKCDHEFIADLYFTEWALAYLRDLLEDLERKGKLPVHVISVYEKLVKCNTPEEAEDARIRVSYILPTKNRDEFLKVTLGNIRKLLTPQDELIVVDGGSTDGTLATLNQNRDIITKVISEKDECFAHAVNKGILIARGEYIKTLQDDDVIFPQEFERAMGYLGENPEIDLLVCGGIKQSGNRPILTQAPDNYGHDVRDVFRYGACGTGFIYRHSSLAKMGLLDTTNVDCDQEIAVRAIGMGLKVEFFPGRHYSHAAYIHSTSILNLRDWNKGHYKLVKQYCSKFYYYKYMLCKRFKLLNRWIW